MALETPFKAEIKPWSRPLPEQKLPPVQPNFPLGVLELVSTPMKATTQVNLTLLGGSGNLPTAADVRLLPLVPIYSTKS